MSEEPARKRRHYVYEGAPTNQPASVLNVIASIDSLPDDVLQNCFSFIGKGHYRFVAGTSRRFQEIYSIKHEKKTTWENAASSIASAELCADDFKENGREEEDTDCLKMTTKGAMKIGNIKVLEWARIKGFAFDSEHFLLPAFNGHLCVLQWAEEKNLEWYGEETLMAAANGHIPIFEWVYNSEREMLGIEQASFTAAFCGHVPVLSWMEERNLLDTSSAPSWWELASEGGHVNVLDWTHDNGYVIYPHSIFLGAATSGDNYLKPLVWARQHGIRFDEYASVCAAFNGNLPMLQWLRENDCPWNARVIYCAENEGHDNVLEWAIANGCPTE